MNISIYCLKPSNDFLKHTEYISKSLWWLIRSCILWPWLFYLLDLISCQSSLHSQWSSHTGFLGVPPMCQAHSCPKAFVLADFFLPGMFFLHITYCTQPLSLCCLLAKLLTLANVLLQYFFLLFVAFLLFNPFSTYCH